MQLTSLTQTIPRGYTHSNDLL